MKFKPSLISFLILFWCGTAFGNVLSGATASISSGSNASNSNDGNVTTFAGGILTGAGQYIKWDIGTGKYLTSLRIWQNDNVGNAPDDFIVQGSNDNTNWTPLQTVTNLNMSIGAWFTVSWTNVVAYRYLRLMDLNPKSEPSTSVYEVEAFETVPASGSSSSAIKKAPGVGFGAGYTVY